MTKRRFRALATIMNAGPAQVKHAVGVAPGSGPGSGLGQVDMPATSQSPSTFSIVTVTQFL